MEVDAATTRVKVRMDVDEALDWIARLTREVKHTIQSGHPSVELAGAYVHLNDKVYPGTFSVEVRPNGQS